MKILAINPWIYDFAAYDFWLKPYGFLVLLQYLYDHGCKIEYIDCLEAKISSAHFGRGKYHSEIIPKPVVLQKIPRYYKRYGIPFSHLESRLRQITPDIILLTSSMTYWYPAFKDLIPLLRKKIPAAQIFLGGTYATICTRHAKKTFPEATIIPNSQLKNFFDRLQIPYTERDLFTLLPHYENFYNALEYIVLRTSWGCPFCCHFCAIKHLSKKMIFVPPSNLNTYIEHYAKKGIQDFIFYDDALLYNHAHIKTILEPLAARKTKLRFHTPNALHLKYLDQDIAVLLKKSGFINPHFGLETTDPLLQSHWGDKVSHQDLMNAIEYMKSAGFKNGEFSVYLLLGYPHQDIDKLKQETLYLHKQGIRISLAEFSLVPKTKFYTETKKHNKDPLFHNNSIFYFFPRQKLQEIWELKNFVRKLNENLNPKTNG